MNLLRTMKKYFLPLLLCYACQFKGKMEKTALQDNSAPTYTCSMHPNVRRASGGMCPVCHMDLVLQENNASDKESNTVHLSTRALRLANIRTQSALMRTAQDKRSFTGTLNVPDRQRVSVSLPINARIDTLWVRERGMMVRKGQLLLAFYSELLNDTKDAYRSAWHQVRAGNKEAEITLRAARQKLLLWSLTPSDIDQIPYENPMATTRVYSPISGYISEINVREGDYIYAEKPLLYLVNQNMLRAEIPLFTEQMPRLNKQTHLSITAPYLSSNQTAYLTNQTLFPFISPNAYTQFLLISLPNASSRDWLSVGLRVQAQIANTLPISLYLPRDAIIMTAQGATAWVQLREGVFQRRDLVLGKQANDFCEVIDGVKAGEEVVVSGAYLLHSAYELQQN